MIIKTSNKTRECMDILGIEEFPFSEKELKTKYRLLLKRNHPDASGAGETDKTIQIIAAYKHLKNLVAENIETEGEKPEEPDDIFNLTEKCPICNGKGVVARREWAWEGCEKCGGTGKVNIKCKYCNDGKFTTRSGKIVDCRVCKGTGIWRTKTCTCARRHVIFSMYDDLFGHYEEKIVNCSRCGGSGKIELDLFNPVIPKGAVLNR